MSQFISPYWRSLLLLVPLFLASCGPKPDKTIENLKQSLVDQVNACARYESFAQKAVEEGYLNVANFFRAIAYSEKVYIEKELALLKSYQENIVPATDSIAVGSTLENLKQTVEIQDYNHQTLFPIFVSVAADEEAATAGDLFHSCMTGAKRKARLSRRNARVLERENSDWNVVNSWSVCKDCGQIYVTVNLSESCEGCQKSSSSFALFQ